MHEPVEPTLVEPTLIEAADVTMTADQALNAVEVEVVDQGGAGFAFLLGPAQVTEFTVKLLAELGAFSRRSKRHLRAVQMTDRSHPPLSGRRLARSRPMAPAGRQRGVLPAPHGRP
jgi:hypothetical protein